MELVQRILQVEPVGRPLVSICIANYNGDNMLEACLDSIFSQECDYPYEVIVHDDASTDNALDRIVPQYSQVEYLVSSENVGYCVSNNRMAEVAKGQFILLLNNDAVLKSGALSALTQHALKQSCQGILTLRQYDSETKQLLDAGMTLDLFLNPVPSFGDQRPLAMCIGACLWVPKKLWLECQGFPSWFESIAEDMLLCCRARLLGYSVEVVRTSGYLHANGASFGGGKVSNNQLSTSLKRRRLSERNKTLVMLCCYPLRVLIPILPIHFFALIVEGIVLAIVRRRPMLFVSIYWHVFTEIFRLKNLWQEMRQTIQVSRRTSVLSFLRAIVFFPHKLTLLFKFGFPQVK